jgi:hypothetical protein
VYYLRDSASIDTQISATGPSVCELWPLEFDCRHELNLKVFSDAIVGARERVVAVNANNKTSSLLYPMISNRPGLNKDIMEIFVKQIGTNFVTLEFSIMRGIWYRF